MKQRYWMFTDAMLIAAMKDAGLNPVDSAMIQAFLSSTPARDAKLFTDIGFELPAPMTVAGTAGEPQR